VLADEDEKHLASVSIQSFIPKKNFATKNIR
jgi:hypothetical protein